MRRWRSGQSRRTVNPLTLCLRWFKSNPAHPVKQTKRAFYAKGSFCLPRGCAASRGLRGRLVVKLKYNTIQYNTILFYEPHVFYVYILLSQKDSDLYIGFSNNLKNRIQTHFSGGVISTKDCRPLKLIYYEAYLNEQDAKKREVFLKSGSGHKFLKIQLHNYFKDYLNY